MAGLVMSCVPCWQRGKEGGGRIWVVADVRRSVCAVCVSVSMERTKQGHQKSTCMKREGQDKEGQLDVVLVVRLMVASIKKRTWQIIMKGRGRRQLTKNQSHRK